MEQRSRLLSAGKEVAVLTLSSVLVAMSVFFFLIPSSTTVGSVTGVAILLANVMPVPVSTITMVLNIVLLVIGFFTCGKEFGAKTVYTSLVVPAVLWVLERLFPDFQSITGIMELDALCNVLVTSVGLCILFSRNASSGGLDIVAKIMNRYLHMDLGKALAASGMCVALSSALFYDGKTVVISVLCTYFSGVVLDDLISNQNRKRRVSIICDQVDQVRDFVIGQLHSGATIYSITGAYHMEARREIVVLTDKYEYQKLMDYLQKHIPGAFVTVYNVSDARYRPKTRAPEELL